MVDVTSSTRCLLALSMLKGVGPKTLSKVAAVPDFERRSGEELLSLLPQRVAGRTTLGDLAKVESEASRQIDLALADGARIISAADDEYPKLLSATHDDPQILFIKGHLTDAPDKSIAIIGTREPTEHGKVIVQRLTGFFAGQSWSVISGLAIGCDTIAHEAALAAGGHTVAVLAHGLHTVAPSSNKKLAQRIVDSGGALVTEYHFGHPPLPTNFVKRDRIQAGLAKGVVMVQSDIKGGSLHASRASIDYGRWLAVPFPTKRDINDPKVRGNLLLADGSSDQKAELLRCNPNDLEKVIILRGREDYTPKLLTSLAASQAQSHPDPRMML